jgi:hypothetical protein
MLSKISGISEAIGAKKKAKRIGFTYKSQLFILRKYLGLTGYFYDSSDKGF